MSGQLVTVATFAAPAEAELARQRLQRDGIAACLADELTGGILGLTTGGLSSVKVQVNAADQERAAAILALTEHRGDQDDEGVATWTCPHCRTDVNAEFEVCWSCGTTVEGQADPSFIREAMDPSPADETGEDDEAVPAVSMDVTGRERPLCAAPEIDLQPRNPYRAPGSPSGPVAAPVAEPPIADTTYGDEVAARAWRASVLSALLCPPLLTFYSVWLVLKIAFADHPLSSVGMRKFYGAMAVNVLVWIMVVLVWHRLFFI
mgnify:CR=1 FL=1